MRIPVLALTLASALLPALPAAAEPTEITIRVLSRDAKFIGSSMGGMRIVLRDAHTGAILAAGATSGGTGDTKRLMHADGGRRQTLADASAASYSVTLDLEEPRLIEVEAFGPMAQLQAAQRVSSTQWVIPGRHLSGGDGWVLEMRGFAVDVLAPPAHIKLAAVPGTINVRANVTLMCGCPVEPGGIWDASKYEVRALLKRNGAAAGSFPLAYAGETSQFAADLPVTESGTYEVTVFAHDPASGNTGLDRTTFIVD
jgi:hypothetical protein